MNEKQTATELKDLQVERVDGVDRPATGRKFLLFKDKDAGAHIMKGYAMTATAGAEVLKAIRKDASAKVGKSTAIAINGLAQVLGQEPVFLSKAVPTQPYEFSEPDADKRGPADQDLGPNFTPRSMPGSMVGRVQFSVKSTDERMSHGDREDAEEYTANKATDERLSDGREDAAEYTAGKKKEKASAKAKQDEAEAEGEKEMPWEKAVKSLADAVKSQGEQIASIAGAVEKIAKGERLVAKAEDEPEATPVRKNAPRSRQVEVDDEPEARRVQKGAGKVSFADVFFGGK